MNNEEKFRLKLKLLVELCTPKEIQQWAEEIILKDPLYEFALHLCCMRSEDEIAKYFYDLNPELLNIDTQHIALSVLKEYVQKRLPKQLDEKYEHHFQT